MNPAKTPAQLNLEAAYDAARLEAASATRLYMSVTKRYRAGEAGDAEYLSAREAFQNAEAAFDRAETAFIEGMNAMEQTQSN